MKLSSSVNEDLSFPQNYMVHIQILGVHQKTKKPKHNFVIKWGFTITVCPQETCVCIWKPENLQQRGTDKHKHSPGKLSQLFWV